MRMNVYAGWLLVVLGVASLGGAGLAGEPAFGALMAAVLVGTGAFLVWLSAGWDKPLADAAELYRFGRPANAVVTRVEDHGTTADGVWTAKLTLDVAPVNERRFTTTRVLALPGGRLPAVGEEVTVKFDPQSRKNLVLAEGHHVVEDQVTAAARLFGAAAPTA